MQVQCWQCKGRGFCNRGFCVIRQKLNFQKSFNERAKEEFFGASYNVFVGRHNYPNVNVGVLAVDEKKEEYDNPKLWVDKDLDIQQIMSYRSSLVNSHFVNNVKSFSERLTELTQEVSLSTKPVDVEIGLEKKPSFALSFSQDITPFGPSVKLKHARLTENPKIPSQVEYVVADELKTTEQLQILSRKGYDELYLTKILSTGLLGKDENKKLVPTRWSITAVDDTLSQNLLQSVREYPFHEHSAYFGGYLGNFYLILCFPRPWSYELFESHVGGESYMTDYEDFHGRKQYAFDTAGGYYAARLAITEKLQALKRQATVLTLRFITDDYYAPLGVWVVREATRKAMAAQPLVFESQQLLIQYAQAFVKKRFGKDIAPMIVHSKIFSRNLPQQTLSAF
jgi:DNA repair protein NreA